MSTSRMGWSQVLAFLLASIYGSGCGGGGGDAPPREAIAGTVTLDGKPLPRGTIEFTPSGPSQGTPGSAPISDGGYSFSGDQGLVAGPYAVRVYAAVNAATSADAMPGEPGPPPKEPIPPRYNTNTTLNVEVAKGQDKPIPFDLKTR